MAKIEVNQKNINNIEQILALCPFNAIECINDEIIINAGCKMCKLCVKREPQVFAYIDKTNNLIDKDNYKDIAVFIEQTTKKIHPVSFELLGKARSMAKKIGHDVKAVIIGSNVENLATLIKPFGADKIFIYDDSRLEYFNVESYTAVVEQFIKTNKPSVFLFGGTVIGRSLAPRVAARFRSGLTADCTVLDIQNNTDLDQIRPAFGGNIMAHILTPNTRPQFATVRHKVFDAPQKDESLKCETIICDTKSINLASNIETLSIEQKQPTESIEDAEILVVAGAGVKDDKGLAMVREVASLLGGKVASTRHMVEKGNLDARLQIGLSGRTVRPKLILTCGVSGAIQFVAGMSSSENIIAINSDKNAPIFTIAHYALIGDLYEILPRLIENIKNNVVNGDDNG